MHEALKIPELVLRILNFANSAGDVYSIALVCRFFADLALEVLWTDWPVSVEGLLALLPDDLLYFRPSSDTKRSMISFQRSLVPRDWERIIDIGPSVKNLTYTERPEQLDSQVPRQYHPGYNLTSGYPKMATSQNVFYQLAFHRQSSHILPNLERLRWSAAPRLIILFLCPTLRALEMASSEYETGIFSEVEMRLSAANLKTLKLEVEEPSSHLDPTLEELSRLFEWAEELTDVTLSRGLVDSPVFISLSKLPQLRVLRIIGRLQSGLLFDFATTRGLARPSKAKRIKPAVPKAKSKWVTGRTPVATTGGWAAQSESDEWYESFPELRSLDLVITVNAAGFFSDVRCISSIGLASITITFSGNLVKDLKDILVAISERCPGLQYLNIRPDNEHYNFIEADTRMQDVYQKPHRVQRISRSLITVDFFKPILMLKELEELVLEWPYAAQVNQADMQLMVNSWPNIVSLYITPAPFFILPERPRLHITCLKHIFVRTTQLKRLALFIDATRETGQSNEGIGVQAGVETLEEFDPGRSWISDRAYALDHLQEAFPNVRIPAVERRLTRWGDVARSLKSGMPIPAVTESAPKARPYVLRRVRP